MPGKAQKAAHSKVSKDTRKEYGCMKANWCERHWCRGCKKAREAQEGSQGIFGLGHGIEVGAGQQSGE
jgi:hypothetical protein